MKNTFVKVLSFLMALTMIVGTLGTVVVFAADCTHEGAEVIADVAATCNAIGYKKYHCGTCGEEFIGDVTPAKENHNYKEVPAKGADCLNPAYTKGLVCADCNQPHTDPTKAPHIDTTVNEGKPLGHTPSKYTVEVAKTCTENAYTANQCVRCDVLVNKVEKPNTAGHEFLYEIETAATTCISGKVIVTCSECDFKDVIIQAADHEWVKMTIKAETTGTALEKKYYAGDDCSYTWKSGEYCPKCWETRNTVELSDATHSDINVTLAENSSHAMYKGEKLTATNITAEIAKLTNPKTGNKFVVGDITFVKATCENDGWHLSYCEDCQKFNVKVDKKLGDHSFGNWTDWTGKKGNTNVTVAAATKKADIEKGQYHDLVLTQTRTCSKCGKVETNKTTPTAHSYTSIKDDPTKYTDEHKVTCTENGYVVYTCNMKCGETHTDITDIAKGEHSWDDNGWKKVKDYNCATNAVLERFCTNPECDTDLNTAKAQVARQTKADANAKHSMKAEIVPGTCVAVSYYQNKCEICKAVGTGEYAYKGDALANAAKDPANHVASYNLETGAAANATATDLAPKQAYTCTTDEISYFVCACGERVELVTRKADGHNYVTGGVDETKAGGASNVLAVYTKGTAGTEGYVYKDFEPVAPTCFEKGQTAGTLCVDCGAVVTAPTELAINPSNHANYGALAGTEVTTPATCVSTAKKSYNCAKCYVKIETEYKEAGKDKVEPNANYHVNMKFVAEKNAVCVNDGMFGHYYCSDCKGYYNDAEAATAANAYTTEATDKTTADKLVIKGDKNHTWSTNTSSHPGNNVTAFETCDRDGVREYRFCVKCQEAAGNIADGWNNIKVLVTVQLQNKDLTVVTDDPATKDKNEAYEAIRIPAHGATYTKDWSYLVKLDADKKVIGATCTTGAWVAIAETPLCMYCQLGADRNVTDAWVGTAASGAAWQAPLDHKNVDGTSALTVINRVNLVNIAAEGNPAQYVVADCTKASYERSECSLCKETWLTNYAPAKSDKGHVYPKTNDKGEYAEADILTREPGCVTDGAKYVKCTLCQTTKDIEVIPATGHYVLNGTTKTYFTFECEDYAKFKGFTCSGECKETVNLDTIKHNPVTDEVKVTCTTDGYSVTYCKDCTLEYDKAIAQYYKHKGHDVLQDGTKLTPFKIAEDATKTTYRCQVCGENYDVAKTVVVPFNAVVTYSADKIAAGETVDVIVTVSGKAVNYTSALVTLNFNADLFEIADVAAGDAKATAVAGDKKVSIYVPNDAEGNAQTAAVAAEGTVVVTVTLKAKRYANGSDKITATVLFNEGTKTAVTAAAQAEQKLAVTVAGLGNLNGDAYFTAEDALAIHNLIGKDYNATADVNNDGEVNLADAIAVAKYAASNKKAIDFLKMIGEYDAIEEIVMGLYNDGLLVDMDGDRAVLINDVYKLLNKIDSELNVATFKYESVEDLVYSVMTK